MNAKTSLVAAALALIAAGAQAGELVSLPDGRSTLTRAEVQAELLRARAAGELIASGDSYGLQWARVQTPRVQLPALAGGTERRDTAQRNAAPAGPAAQYVGG